jgi:SAM-dependent methyltransferase
MSSKIKSFKVKNCRICNSKKLYNYINLGNQPPSNSFVKKKDISKQKKFPLKVILCKDCGLSQLDTVVLSIGIFDKYSYLSSTSKALIKNYEIMVKKIIQRFRPKKNDLIIDIGCNDGITLDLYQKNEYSLLGIEPSSAYFYAKKKKFNVIKRFFNFKLSQKIKKKSGEAKIITATNVFAHNHDINDFTKGIKNLLDKQSGVFVIEFPYIRDMLKQLYFDTIYHEHLSYFAISPLKILFQNHGLKIFDYEKTLVGASGPAMRIYVSHIDSKYRISKKINDILKTEKKWGVKKIKAYKKFSNDVKKLKIALLKIIKRTGVKNKLIGAYGAPAKGNTLLNYLGLNSKQIFAIADNSITKINHYAPGSNIKVISDEEFLKIDCKYAILLAWNYADFFLKNSKFILNNGKFILPLPKPKIIPNEKN